MLRRDFLKLSSVFPLALLGLPDPPPEEVEPAYACIPYESPPSDVFLLSGVLDAGRPLRIRLPGDARVPVITVGGTDDACSRPDEGVYVTVSRPRRRRPLVRLLLRSRWTSTWHPPGGAVLAPGGLVLLADSPAAFQFDVVTQSGF